jgi:chemotaxis response regulator CheB
MDVEESTANSGAIDILMTSTASLMTDRSTAILLSGSTDDGTLGMECILKKNGTCFILNPDHCLHKTMINGPMERFNLQGDLDENRLASEIQKCHFANKENVITA